MTKNRSIHSVLLSAVALAMAVATTSAGEITYTAASSPTPAPKKAPKGLFGLFGKKDDGKDVKDAKAAPTPCGKKANEGFLQRLNEAYMEQMAVPVFSTPAPGAPPSPVRRIGAPPFDGPPYPTQDWQLGGGPPGVMGDPMALRDSPYPFMQAVYDGPHGCWWYDSKLMLYGWVTITGNVSSSHNTGPSQVDNFPEVYPERGNRIENDQDVIYLERCADENQTDHFDWGFRFCMLYGLDYRFMASRGYINDTNLFITNKFQGFDDPMMYVNLYIPQVAQGMQIIIGRIISEPDIEQQLAPNNLMASHSLVYSFDNYTMWGVWPEVKLNKNWLIQLGIASGVDTAPWAKKYGDPGCQPTGSIMIQWIGDGGHDSFYIGMNSLNNGKFGFNNLQECIESYSHKFNDTWWTTFEGQYMWTNGVTTEPTVQVPIEDGFYPVRPGRATVYGAVNYTCCRLAANSFLTIRNEGWNDVDGYRSGYASPYSEHAIGITWWPNKILVIRPEIRFEHAYKKNGLESSSGNDNSSGAPEVMYSAYDNGTRQSQLSFVCDATFHF